MTEIKNAAFIKTNLACNVLGFINHILPLRLKFLSETFVALEDGVPKGFITLEKDSKSLTRFKITALVLEEYSLGYQLANYVITRYHGMGADYFYVVADEKQADLINIFKNELSFRLCGYEYLYKINPMDLNYTRFLKNLKKENINDVCKFYNESISSYNRFLFSRQNYQFQNGCAQYIFYDEASMKVLGYFEVASKNNVDFYINFVIDIAYNTYILDAIKFIYSEIQRKTKNFNLYIKVKDYFLNSKELIAILNENKTEFISKSQILAKDYYRHIKQDNLLKNVKIFFNDPTIA
ncbi:GNAT family N-acetyltransferase [bacterium]|nr:GNAT family N-acetyltransferase [bacterium]